MPKLVIGSEKSVADVVKRAYPGKMSAAAAKRVAAAVEKANPETDLERLSRGTILTVPDVPDAPRRPSKEVLFEDSAASAAEGLRNVLTSGVDELIAIASREESAATKERAQIMRAFDSDEIRSAMDDDERLADDLKAVYASLEEQEAGAEQRLAAINRLGAQWAGQLDVLKKMLP
jgi:hypothetical protein